MKWSEKCRWSATSRVHYTTSCNTLSSVPEDGQNNCPKHVELTGIVNNPLLLHLVGCLYYLYFIIFFWNLLNNLNLTLILKKWRIWWAPNNASNGRRDLIRRLKVNCSSHCLRAVVWPQVTPWTLCFISATFRIHTASYHLNAKYSKGKFQPSIGHEVPKED